MTGLIYQTNSGTMMFDQSSNVVNLTASTRHTTPGSTTTLITADPVVESVFATLKQRYGDRLKGRTWYGQFRELAIKAAVKT